MGYCDRRNSLKMRRRKAQAKKKARLKRRAEFLRVASKGRKAAVHGLVLQALPRDDADPARLGFTVTKNPATLMLKWNGRGEQRQAASAAQGPDAYLYQQKRTTTDVNFTYQIKRWLQVFANGRNIFNVHYNLMRYGSQTPAYAKISSTNADQEEAVEELEIDYGGENIDIGFNVTYLLDVLNNLKCDQVNVALGDSNSSALISIPDNADFKYVVARVNTRTTLEPHVEDAANLASAQGTVIKWKDSAGQGCRRLDGGACQPVDEAQAVAFARTLYQGPASTPATAMKLQAGAPSQWGIVREFRSSSPAWQVRFQDDLQQRVYVSVATGEYLGARNDRWVLYDFFWRLHVMDYSEGEDFNHPLIRVASALALLLSLTGLVMLAMAVRRRWRRGLAARA